MGCCVSRVKDKKDLRGSFDDDITDNSLCILRNIASNKGLQNSKKKKIFEKLDDTISMGNETGY